MVTSGDAVAQTERSAPTTDSASTSGITVDSDIVSDGAIIEMSRGEPKRFRWDFSRRNDRDFDGWPDGWKRFRGPAYPQYVSIGIVARDPQTESRFRRLDGEVVRLHRWLSRRWPSTRIPLPAALSQLPPALSDLFTDRYLKIDLDGGLAMVQSGVMETSALYQYRFRCRIMTQGLRYDQARAALVFVDAQGQLLASHPTTAVTGSTSWTELVVDRLRPPMEATGMAVRLIVEGSEDGLEDIRGVIGLDDVTIEKFPQLSITTDEALGVYAAGNRAVAKATVMGLPSVATELQFRLSDRDGIELASRTLPLEPKATNSTSSESLDAAVEWQLPPLEPGFYRVSVGLLEDDQRDLVSETTLAVIDELVPGPVHGVFGWTLPDGLEGPAGTRPIEAREVGRWLARLGVAWVKYPCWVAPDDELAADRVAAILGRLQDHDIQTVGMLDEPPASELRHYDVRGRRIPNIADLLRDRETWQPLLEPVMTRLTLKVKLWQLGADRDYSFVGRPRLNESVREITQGLQGFGQPIDIAISWPWLEPEAGGRGVSGNPGASWKAVSRGSEPELTADELDAYLAMESGSGDSWTGEDPRLETSDRPRTWLLLSPISKAAYDRDHRIRDLVMRMAAVRKHPVQAAFVADPRDEDRGLIRADGRPDELLLPWRTTARLIGNLQHAGSLQLRSGAENAVFSDQRRAVLMVWAAEPTEELIYLGREARQVDVWGRSSELPTEVYRGQTVHRVSIGTTPSFLVGVDPVLLGFRMSVDLRQKQLDSVLGSRQRLSVAFRNPTGDNLAGEIEIDPPSSWEIETESPYWELLRGRGTLHPFEVVLSNSASVGTYELPIRFKLQTAPPQQITVYRKLHVGPEGLDINVRTRLLENGDLEVRLQMINQSDAAQAYDCMLFPGHGRQYDRRIIGLDAHDTEVRLFRWPNGKELVGRTILLRATEQDGQRVLNYSIPVKP